MSPVDLQGPSNFQESGIARVNAPASNLKILLVAHKFPPFIGGIEMHTFEVGRRMASQGHSVTVLTADPSETLPSEETVSGMRVVRVKAYRQSGDMFFAPAAFNAIVAEHWDIIHIQGFHTLVPPIAMMAALRRKIPFVMTFHSGGHSSSARNLIRGIQCEVLRPFILRAAQLIGVSRFEAEHFASALRLDPKRIIVVPNGAEIEVPESRILPDMERPLILSIGRLERYKGHHRAIAAFAEILKAKPQARLRVLGEGPYKPELQKLVQNLGLTRSVTIGGIPPADRKGMGQLIQSASVIVLLSEYEAHPVAALECISLGRPVIANNSTGFKEMVEAGLLRGVDPQASSEIIGKTILDEIDHEFEEAPKVAIGNWDTCTLKLLDVYRNVLARGTPITRSKPRADDATISLINENLVRR